MADWDGLFARARRQHGALGVGDGTAFGLSAAALRAHALRHGWPRPYQGSLLVPGVPLSYPAFVAAALRTSGDRALGARWTAAFLSGITTVQPEGVELVVPYGRMVAVSVLDAGLRPPPVVVRRSRTLVRADVAAGGTLTRPARTLVDLAAVTGVDRLRGLVIDARQRRLATLEEVREVWARLAEARGRGRVAQVLAELDEEVCDSVLEHRWRRLLRAAGLRPYPRPFPFRCPDGVVIEIDVAFPAHWVACECDGLGSRGDRAGLVKHQRRQNAGVQGGWQPFLVDWTRLVADPAGLIADLRRLLARADTARPPARPASPAEVDERFRGRRSRAA